MRVSRTEDRSGSRGLRRTAAAADFRAGGGAALPADMLSLQTAVQPEAQPVCGGFPQWKTQTRCGFCFRRTALFHGASASVCVRQSFPPFGSAAFGISFWTLPGNRLARRAGHSHTFGNAVFGAALGRFLPPLPGAAECRPAQCTGRRRSVLPPFFFADRRPPAVSAAQELWRSKQIQARLSFCRSFDLRKGLLPYENRY